MTSLIALSVFVLVALIAEAFFQDLKLLLSLLVGPSSTKKQKKISLMRSWQNF